MLLKICLLIIATGLAIRYIIIRDWEPQTCENGFHNFGERTYHLSREVFIIQESTCTECGRIQRRQIYYNYPNARKELEEIGKHISDTCRKDTGYL